MVGPHVTNIGRRRLPGLMAVVALLALAPAEPAHGVVTLQAQPIPTPHEPSDRVVVGQTIDYAISIENRSSPLDGPLTVAPGDVALAPSCTHPGCVAPETDVFVVAGSAVGQSDGGDASCAGDAFATAPTPAGRVRFTSPAPFALAAAGTPGDSCTIVFQALVARLPAIDVEPLVAGIQTLARAEVHASSALGGVDAAAVVPVTVAPASTHAKRDETAPDTRIDDGPRGLARTASATFAFSSSERGSTFQCRLDDAPFAACATPHAVQPLSAGPHTFEVLAIDPAGNPDASPAARAFTIAVAPPSGRGPSSRCHVTDGEFTACAGGGEEWSDVAPSVFASSGAFLYADQADLVAERGIPGSPVDTFMLLYDECDRRAPLGPDEFFAVNFDTVEQQPGGPEELDRMTVHVFGDGTIAFFRDGVLQRGAGGAGRVDEIDGQRGAAGFGPSPDCPFNHLVVEYEIELGAAGGNSYSPDPAYWSGTPPRIPPVARDDEARLQDDAVVIAVIANDSDADGTIDPASIRIASPPQDGSAVANANGTVTYTPDAGTPATVLDSFSYTVDDDDNLTSNVATVEVVRPCPAAGAGPQGSSPWAAGEFGSRVDPAGSDVDKDGVGFADETERVGTSPCNHDTDDDGLADPWEIVNPDIPGAGFDLDGDGTVDVPSSLVFDGAGAPRPLEKDVFVEIDSYDCTKGGCPIGDPMVHELTPAVQGDLQTIFSAMGMRLHLLQDEHIPHRPHCDRPPISTRGGPDPRFGTSDQRGNLRAPVIAAKELAFRYAIIGHSSTFDDSTPCPTPPAIALALGAVIGIPPLPEYDNTPFGFAAVGGRDMVVSLGPLWVCPGDKKVPNPLLLLNPASLGSVPLTTYVCQAPRTRTNPSLFPANVANRFLAPVDKPYSRLLGAATELDGITQLQGRALAHLLGHLLGLAGEAEVGNRPQMPTPAGMTYLRPEPYPAAAQIQLGGASTTPLHAIAENGEHLSFTPRAVTAGTADATVDDNPIGALVLTDTDGDGVVERDDTCSGVANAGQEDLDGDGVGDACDPDVDGDGVENGDDPQPADSDDDGVGNAADGDDDGDGVADGDDVCPLAADPAQADTDGDGAGDACDGDADGDGSPSMVERVTGSDPLVASSTPEYVSSATTCGDGDDNDGDGDADAADAGCVDADGDTLPDSADPCAAVADFGWGDSDGDGTGNACDDDSDADGFGDADERDAGSDPTDEHSTPEGQLHAGTCEDGVDNDHDGLTDLDDAPCQIAGKFGAPAIRAGFDATSVPANDDGSAGPVPIGFDVGLGERLFDELYVNTNGSVTFESPLADYTPFGLATVGQPIIAPFFADVDTRTGPLARHDSGTVGGRAAFGVTWQGVDCYRDEIAAERSGQQALADGNAFQLVLVDRSDVAAGAFDVELNYDRVEWEAGEASGGDLECLGGTTARAGLADALAGGTAIELPGSGTPGALLDLDRTTGLALTARASGLRGRHVLEIRPRPDDGDGDGTDDELDNCPDTANADQRDTRLVGIGDACQTPDLHHSTAGILHARLDATTVPQPMSTALSAQPSIEDRLVAIVGFRLAAGLATSAAELTSNLVDSLVDSGLVQPAEADELISEVVRRTTPPTLPPPSPPGVPPPPPPPPPPPAAGPRPRPPIVAPLPPVPDRTAPVIRSLRVSPARARQRGRRPIALTVRFSLSEAASARIAVERITTGRRRGSRCVAANLAPRGGRRCDRVAVVATLTQRSAGGVTTRRISSRVRGRLLPRGRYRVTLVATDAAGNRSPPRTAAFRIA